MSLLYLFTSTISKRFANTGHSSRIANVITLTIMLSTSKCMLWLTRIFIHHKNRFFFYHKDVTQKAWALLKRAGKREKSLDTMVPLFRGLRVQYGHSKMRMRYPWQKRKLCNGHHITNKEFPSFAEPHFGSQVVLTRCWVAGYHTVMDCRYPWVRTQNLLNRH